MARRSARRSAGRGRARPADRRLAVVLALAAAAMAGAVFLGALDNPFVYDDRVTVVDNPSIRDPFDPRVLLADVFRPVVNLSYALDLRLSGPEPRGFHRTNTLLHMAAVVLLFAWVRRLLADGRARGSWPGEEAGDPWWAFVAAALLAVHPLTSQAVGYVSGRSEVLSTAFVLGFLLVGRRALVERRPTMVGVALLLLTLALGSKESAAVAPVVLLLADRWLLPGDTSERRRRLVRFHLPLLALLAVAAVARVVSFVGREAVGQLEGLWRNLLVEAVVAWRYLRLLVVPAGQSLVHDVRSPASMLDPAGLLALAALAAVVVVLVRTGRRRPLLCLGGAWFLLALAPSHLVPLAEPMAEHRVYSAMPGFCLVVAAVAGRLSPDLRRRGLGGRSQAAILALALAGLATLTVTRTRVWSDPVSLWEEAARRAPGAWAAQYSLGNVLREAGRCADAVAPYERAVELRPEQLEAYWNLAICLAETGHRGEARRVLEAALAKDPANPKTHNNLGTLAWIEGDVDEARRQYRAAIRHDPGNVQARLQLARLAEAVDGDLREALELYREVHRLAPAWRPRCEQEIRRLQARLVERRKGPGGAPGPGR